MFRYEPIFCPEENPVLGIYLSLSIDVITYFMSKILNLNDAVIHRSRNWYLKLDEIQSKEHKAMCYIFDESVADHLDPLVYIDDVEYFVIKNTTTYYLYCYNANNNGMPEILY